MSEKINKKIEIVKDKAVRGKTMLCVKFFKMENEGMTSKTDIVIGILDCIDDNTRTLYFTNGINVPIDDIFDISGSIFDDQ